MSRHYWWTLPLAPDRKHKVTGTMGHLALLGTNKHQTPEIIGTVAGNSEQQWAPGIPTK